MKALRKRAPATPTWKRHLHTIYLLQPILQFLVLVVAILALSRCSPLSPSTDINGSKDTKANIFAQSNAVDSALNSDWINKNLHTLAETNVAVSSGPDFATLVKNAADLTSNVNAFIGDDPTAGTQISPMPPVLVGLNTDQIQQLMQQGSLEVNLAGSLKALKQDDQSTVVDRLQNEPNLVNVKAYFVIPGDQTEKDLSLRIRVAVAIADAQQAVLKLEVISHDTQDQAANTALLQALRDAKRLSLILD